MERAQVPGPAPERQIERVESTRRDQELALPLARIQTAEALLFLDRETDRPSWKDARQNARVTNDHDPIDDDVRDACSGQGSDHVSHGESSRVHP
jgi:hypothetical protein